MQRYIRQSLEIEYYESYLPTTRHRRLRYRSKTETIEVNVRNIDREDARLAFTLSDYNHKEKHQTEVLLYRGKLYMRCWRHLTEEERAAGLSGYAVERLEDFDREYTVFDCETHGDETRKQLINRLRTKTRRYLIIDGDVWSVCGEPRYEIITFGLGHNHGGSGLFVTTNYNRNIPNDRYFSTLDDKKAVEEFNRIAAARGDTESIGEYGKMIEVHLPDCVRLNPKKEHGKGEPFHNMLEEITEKCDSPMEAGLLTIVAASSR